MTPFFGIGYTQRPYILREVASKPGEGTFLKDVIPLVVPECPVIKVTLFRSELFIYF